MVTRPDWKIGLDSVAVVLGTWLVIAPWVLRPGSELAEIATMAALGLVIAAVGELALGESTTRIGEVILAALGVVVFCTPWLLKFEWDSAMTWNSWIVGGAVVVVSGLSFWTKSGADLGPRMAAR